MTKNIESYECNHCSSLFGNQHPNPNGGRCPNCGGVLHINYVKAQQAKPSVSHPYIPHARIAHKPSGYKKARVYAYSKFGWKKATAILFSLLAILVVIIAFSWDYLTQGEISYLADPDRQLAIPTLAPTRTPKAEAQEWWKNHELLNPSESLDLRSQTNVVNVAFLSNGGVLYSKEFSIIFDEAWVKEKPFGFSGVSVSGTSVRFIAYNSTYTLNTYQPFMLDDQIEKFIIFDEAGQAWTISSQEVKFTNISVVIDQLNIIIESNPNLNLSY